MSVPEVEVSRARAEEEVLDRTEARARRFVLHLVWLLPCVFLFAGFFQKNFTALHRPEAMDAAQLGRHISNGEGYRTTLLRPISLDPRLHTTLQPEIQHAPLYPLLLAIGFNLLGGGGDDVAKGDHTVALLATLLGLATALLVYLLALRLFNRTTAGLAALLVSLNVGFLSACVEGAELPLLALLATLLAFLIFRHTGRVRESAWCGATCGLLYLADFAMLPLFVPVAAVVTLSQPSRRRAHLLACLLGLLLFVGPWLVRDWRVTGRPLGATRSRVLAEATDRYPQTTLYRVPVEQAPTSLGFLRTRPREVAKKTVQNFGALEAKFPAVLEGALLLLLGLAIFADLGRRAAYRVRWALLSGAALLILNLAVGDSRFDQLYAFLGVVAVLGVGAFVRLVKARSFSPRAQALLLAALLAVGSAQLLMTIALRVRPLTPDRQSLTYLREQVPADALILTDEPWAVAWYAKRPALWLPMEPGPDEQERTTAPLEKVVDVTRQPAFLALERAGLRPYGLLLTSHLRQYPEAEEMTRWQLFRQVVEQHLLALQRGQAQGEPWAPDGWVMVASFPAGDFLFLREEAVGGAARGG